MYHDDSAAAGPRRPSPLEMRAVWGALYLAIVAITALFCGWDGLLAAAGFLALGFLAGQQHDAWRAH